MSKARRSSMAFVLVAFALLGSLTVFPLAAQFTPLVGQDPSAAGVAALRDIIDTAYHPDLRWPDFSPYRSEVARFYASDGYSLAWIHRGQPRPQALALIRFLQDADSKGLSAEDYDGPRWPERLAKLRESASELDLVRFDAALTVSVMRYVRAVHFGRVNPKAFKFELDVENREYDLADFLRTVAVMGTIVPSSSVKLTVTVSPNIGRFLRPNSMMCKAFGSKDALPFAGKSTLAIGVIRIIA